MITGGRINSVEARRDSDAPVSGLNINIGLDELKFSGGEIEISYTYTVNYADGVGMLRMKGVLYAKEEESKAKEIKKSWEGTKSLPHDFAEAVLNTINFTCGSNGTLVVRPVNLTPPMMPPKIEVSKGGTGAA